MRGVVVGAAGLVAVALAIFGPGCDREDLVVAKLSSAVDASTVDAGLPCFDDDDCPSADLICQKIGCGDALRGSCQLPSCSTPGEYEPECGCDGVTYWNECERQSVDISLFAIGPCAVDQTNKTCKAADDCRAYGLPAETACNIFVAGDHDCAKAIGTCWRLPVDCNEVTNDPALFHPCNGSAPDDFCETQCQAIRNGDPIVFGGDVCGQ